MINEKEKSVGGAGMRELGLCEVLREEEMHDNEKRRMPFMVSRKKEKRDNGG